MVAMIWCSTARDPSTSSKVWKHGLERSDICCFGAVVTLKRSLRWYVATINTIMQISKMFRCVCVQDIIWKQRTRQIREHCASTCEGEEEISHPMCRRVWFTLINLLQNLALLWLKKALLALDVRRVFSISITATIQKVWGKIRIHYRLPMCSDFLTAL